jgi:hypothetical protein
MKVFGLRQLLETNATANSTTIFICTWQRNHQQLGLEYKFRFGIIK